MLKSVNKSEPICRRTIVDMYRTLTRREIIDCRSNFFSSKAVLAALKADSLFIGLQDELANTENKIAVERGRYNEKIQNYNIQVKRFPGVIIARLFGYFEKNYFQATQGAEQAPVIVV